MARISHLPDGRLLDLLTARPDPDYRPLPLPDRVATPPATHRWVDSSLCPSGWAQKCSATSTWERPPGGAFSAEDEQLVTALAATAGVAIANARLLAESEQRHRWLAASSHLTNQLLADETGQPLPYVTQAAMTAADADFATLTVPRRRQ